MRSIVDLEGGVHRAQGVVVMSGGRAEDRHDVVAHVFVDRAAIALDDGIHRLEVAVQECVGRLGAELAGELGIAGQVGKEHGDLAPLAREGRGRRSPVRGGSAVDAPSTGSSPSAKPAMALRSALRSARRLTPRSFRSSLVSSGSRARSTPFSAKVSA
jgi:hypothetical protein